VKKKQNVKQLVLYRLQVKRN